MYLSFVVFSMGRYPWKELLVGALRSFALLWELWVKTDYLDIPV